MNLVYGLNDAQRRAVEHIHGPLLIVAGAGAGKTKVLTHRIANLIQSGISPKNILAITFTNKAAKEMRERALSLLPNTNETPTLVTFHSLGMRILREEHEQVNLPKNFTILDESETRQIIKDILNRFSISKDEYDPKKIRAAISREKGNMVTVEKYQQQVSSYTGEIIAKVWREYEKVLHSEGSVDFDDLLVMVVTLFMKRADILEKYQDRFQYIHIDEYQDTNEVQYNLATLLAKKHKNICVVGDSDQTIYSWRGANIKNILSFERDYKDAQIIFLEENYRSSKNILAAANAVIEKNENRHKKILKATKEDGEKISLYEAYDEKAEAEFVADKIVELRDKGVPADSICVLYRANFQSRIFEEFFIGRHITYHVLGTKFFDRKEVKDVLSYIYASINRNSLSHIKRVINTPTRGIGKTTIVKLFANEELPKSAQKKVDDFFVLLDKIKAFIDTHTIRESIDFIIKETGLEEEAQKDGEEGIERLGNMKELLSIADKYDTEYQNALEHFLEDIALLSDQDSLDKETKGVRLMTVHASKGLEFQYVFIVGLEHGLFPLERDGATKKEDKEEERRLCYVAITRAEKKLFLTYATIRTLFGQRQINAPSEFLYEIPDEYIEKEEWHTNLGRIVYLD